MVPKEDLPGAEPLSLLFPSLAVGSRMGTAVPFNGLTLSSRGPKRAPLHPQSQAPLTKGVASHPATRHRWDSEPASTARPRGSSGMRKSLLRSRVSSVMSLDVTVGKEQAGSSLLLVLAFKKLLGACVKAHFQPSWRTFHLLSVPRNTVISKPCGSL